MAKGKKAKDEGKEKGAAEVEDAKNGQSDDEMYGSDKEQKDTGSKKQTGNKKKNAPKAKKPVAASSDDDSEMEEAVVVKKSGFSLLMDDGDGSNSSNSDDDDKSESEEEVKIAKKKPEKKKKETKKKVEEENEEDEFKIEEEPKAVAAKGGKKGKKKRKKDDDDEEDLEKVLAELELEYAGKKPSAAAAAGAAAEPKQDDKENKKSKKGKKGKKEDSDDDEDDAEMEIIDGIEVGGTVKSAAQKRKEKKERQKQKDKKAAAAAEKDDKSKPDEKAEVETKAEEKGEEEEEKEGEKEKEGEDDDKKKKKKKKKGDKEEEDKKKGGKKPGKGTLLAMQEALKRVQEEQEKAEREEAERIRKEEEAEEARLEKKRLEEEKKAQKKQREKEKKDQLRKEGKLLTAKQKADKARADAMLEAMRAQGMDVPQVGEKRGPRPGTKKRLPKKEKSETPEDQQESEKPTTPPETEPAKTPEEPVAVKDEAEAEDDVKDSWDAEDEVVVVEVKDKKEESPELSQATTKEEEEEDSDESDEDDTDDDSEDDDDDSEEERNNDNKKEKVVERIQRRKEENERNRTTDVLRAPVVCVLGHVDTGKTKILDKLRRTNVQDGEAGGITQQIGATNVPIAVIKEQCKMVREFNCDKLPGLLIIDTPGHESFANLRDRGSSLCDIAILVVDIMHALEPQTIESINLLKKKKTPFVIALNKIDRLYEWKSNRHKDVQEVIEGQIQNTKLEFQKRAKEVCTAMAEQGLNAALFYENPDPKTYISMVPTSAHSGDGMGNLMGLLVKLSQTMLAKRLAYSEELQATVLEVKAIPGLGTTIDVVLVNGRLKEGQALVVAGTEGPIVTQIKALLTPSKMQDLRVKNTYIEHKELKAAQGVKICGKDLDKAIAGLNCLVANSPDEVEVCKEEMALRLQSALSAIKLKERGVFVQASTLGSLEALLEFLKTSKIPYAGVKIGPVVKRDVMKASVMLEHEEKYTVILAFDVKVEKDAQDMADSLGVKIFQADIIYHLFDRFIAYQDDLKRQKREEFKHLAVFPCKLRILPNFVFNSRDPIVAGVIVEAGIIRQGTPLCVPSKEFLEIGICTSIQNNHKEVETARKGDEVCIKIDPIPGESPKMFGRHFDEKDIVMSKITRQTIDVCKEHFRDDLQKSDWQLMVELKKIFVIM